MASVTDEDVKKITGMFRELVNLMTGLGLIRIDQPTTKPSVKKKRKKRTEPRSSTSANTDAQQVLEYYRKTHPRKARGVKPGHDDFNMIKARLQEYTIKELKRAIDANLQCDWHKGVSGGHSLKMIFRNDSKVERFLEGKKEEGPGIGHHPGDKEHKDGPQQFEID